MAPFTGVDPLVADNSDVFFHGAADKFSSASILGGVG